ncbi:hypothetical protein [Glaciibacter superstes]|uniref:hypothetical protein n=1 Tax=Glaciibacter superstes TaxID=501023 RepID=UPI0003B38780|nr:hypothetical protein [Glaciibacter superstes]
MTGPGSGEQVVDEDTQTPVEEPKQIEAWSDWVAQRAGRKPPEPGQIKTPDSIIADLDLMGHLAAQNVRILREADKTRRVARRAHARARLGALKDAVGKDADTRKLEAEVATEEQWESADNAEIAYEYAKSVAELVRSRTSAVQTQSKQVELTYQLAGRGRQ